MCTLHNAKTNSSHGTCQRFLTRLMIFVSKITNTDPVLWAFFGVTNFFFRDLGVTDYDFGVTKFGANNSILVSQI